MKLLYVILGIALFALATAILYAWGLHKAVNRQETMARRLRGTCAGRIVKRMRRQGQMTEAEIAGALKGVRTGEFWSREKAVVGDADAYARELILWMLDQRLLEKTPSGYRLHPNSK